MLVNAAGFSESCEQEGHKSHKQNYCLLQGAQGKSVRALTDMKKTYLFSVVCDILQLDSLCKFKVSMGQTLLLHRDYPWEYCLH